jgi:hypothetical protein
MDSKVQNLLNVSRHPREVRVHDKVHVHDRFSGANGFIYRISPVCGSAPTKQSFGRGAGDQPQRPAMVAAIFFRIMYHSEQTVFTAATKLICLNSFFLQGVHHGRSHPVPAVRQPEASSASFAPGSAIPRSIVCCVRRALDKKHCAMELVPAGGMR